MEIKPGYKQTEVGVIPKDWEFNCLGDMTLRVGSGITPTGGERVYTREGRPFVRSQNVGWGVLSLDDLAYIDERTHASFAATEIVQEDVLLNITGASIGRAAIADTRITGGNVNQHVCIIRADKNRLDPRFLMYFLLSIPGQKQIDSFQAGGNRQGLNFGQIRSFKLVVPNDLREQNAIAAALNDFDDLLSSLDRLIAKKRDIKQAAMQELLTGKTRLPGFRGEWNELNMERDSILKARIGWQGLTTVEYRQTGDYRLVTGTDFDNGRIMWQSCFFVDKSRYVQDRNIQLQIGDILLTKDGTIGKIAYVDELPGPATLNSGVFVIRPKEKQFEPAFFFYILESNCFHEYLAKLQAGSTINHLYQKDFVDFNFRAPSIEEQQAISTVLSDMDAEIEALERRREKTLAVKQGMMQELLTGRVRLI